MSQPEDYRSKFIAQLHNALSGFTGMDVDEAVRLGYNPVPYDCSLTWDSPGTQSRVRAKLLASRSRHGQTIVCDRI